MNEMLKLEYLLKMEVGDEVAPFGWTVLRVPGGWIYTSLTDIVDNIGDERPVSVSSSSCFVPFPTTGEHLLQELQDYHTKIDRLTEGNSDE